MEFVLAWVVGFLAGELASWFPLQWYELASKREYLDGFWFLDFFAVQVCGFALVAED